MNKFLLVIFFLCVVGHIVTKNWTGAMGWFCALIWLGLYELRPTPRALDGADWWDCECGVSNHPSWQACQFCKYPRRQ